MLVNDYLNAFYNFTTVKSAALTERQLVPTPEMYRILKAVLDPVWKAFDRLVEQEFVWDLKDWQKMDAEGTKLLAAQIYRSDPFGDQNGTRLLEDEIAYGELRTLTVKRLAEKKPVPRTRT